MYLDFHQLNLSPFENTPDPRFFFGGEDHREALANIVYALRTGKGLVMITGEIGSGKTTLCHTLLQRAGDAGQIIVIRQAPASPKQLIRHIAKSLGLRPKPLADRTEMFDAVEAELRRRHEMNKTVMLVIDEAQALKPPVFDEIRLLSNIETTTAKLVQIVLLGQNELREMIREPRLEALRQRLVLAHHLKPLSHFDTTRYLNHRLKIASKDSSPVITFDTAAIARIQEITGGIPRLINVTADNCLLVAYVRHQNRITTEIVDAVKQNLVMSEDGTEAAHVLKQAA